MKKGDTVEVLINNPNGSFLLKGDQGEVVKIDYEGDETWVAVDFPFEFQDSHDCECRCANGWWIQLINLKALN